MKVQIQPVQIFPNTATQLEIVGAHIRKFSEEGQAFIVWQLLDSSDNVLSSDATEISGNDYQNWNEDFPHLMNCLLRKLNLTAS
jgi:hypothetical protein